MDGSNEPTNWIPTSFSNPPDASEGDSLSSYHSATTPGSSAVDQQSDDQSFDAISRQKLNLTISSNISHDRFGPRSPRVPGMSMFEEDTRSSWTAEPKPTQLKDVTLDDDSRNSIDSLKSSGTPSNVGSILDQESQLKESAQYEESENSLSSNQKSPEKTPSSWNMASSAIESNENFLKGDLGNDSLDPKALEKVPSVWNLGTNPIDCKAVEETAIKECGEEAADSLALEATGMNEPVMETHIDEVVEEAAMIKSAEKTINEDARKGKINIPVEGTAMNESTKEMAKDDDIKKLTRNEVVKEIVRTEVTNEDMKELAKSEAASKIAKSDLAVEIVTDVVGEEVGIKEVLPKVATNEAVPETIIKGDVQEVALNNVQKTAADKVVPEIAMDEYVHETAMDEDLQEIAFDKSLQETAMDVSVQETAMDVSVQETAMDVSVQETTMDEVIHESVIDDDVRETVQETILSEVVRQSAADKTSENSINCSKTVEQLPASQVSSVWDVKSLESVKETTMDEDSQISTNSQKNNEKTLDSPKTASSPLNVDKSLPAALDEESQSSVTSQKSHTSQKSAKRQRCSDDETNGAIFSAENLFEYMWPQENGEFYILQEQICDYLNIKSFKRKYPDLTRRSVDMDEKQFLKEKGVVTEMQCDLGLTALKSEEVLELMSKDYPDHYKDYIKVLREKEQQSITEKHKEFVATNSDKTKMVDLVKKAVQSAAEYNAHLNQERREERRSCMDLQTYTIHYPVKKSQKTKANTKSGKYPVALLPGQFQDYYKEYTPNEMKYLPLNTVLYGPLKELQSTKALSDGSHSDSDDSSASEGSDCSSSQGTPDDSSSGSEKNENGRSSLVSERNGVSSDTSYRPKVKPNAICKVCKKGPEVKEGRSEELVHCSECDNSSHPACIELTTDVVNVLKTYPWQCMDCKVCSHCSDPNDEDKMLFCDFCDRGYHTFCVGLKTLPQGKWVCRRCGSCSICGATKPGPETSKAQWLYDSSKGVVELDANRKPKIMCQSCFKKKR